MSAITYADLKAAGIKNKTIEAALGISNAGNLAKGIPAKHQPKALALLNQYRDVAETSAASALPVEDDAQREIAQSEKQALKGLAAVAGLTSQVEQLCNAGLHLVAIQPVHGKPTKAPVKKGWNLPISEINPWGYSNNFDDFKNLTDCNIGLYHAASNTLALDLDDVELARQVFEDVTDSQLLDWLENDLRVEIKSPKANRAKLLFKVPPEFSGSLKQLKKPKKDKPREFDVVFELRCGNCQDVVIGQHPEGGNYQLIGNPAAIPEAPPVLLDMLTHWDAWKPCLDSALGIEQEPPKVAAQKPLEGENLKGFRNPIQEFNQAYSVESVLLRNGYRQVSPDRFIRPNSSSRAPGVKILRSCKDGLDRAFSFGADDLNDGYGHSAWDTMRLLEYGGQY
jgi:hypothetical protein